MRAFKLEKMKEVYRMLVYAFGKPPVKFDFEYRDDDNQYHIDRNLTPKNSSTSMCTSISVITSI